MTDNKLAKRLDYCMLRFVELERIGTIDLGRVVFVSAAVRHMDDKIRFRVMMDGTGETLVLHETTISRDEFVGRWKRWASENNV